MFLQKIRLPVLVSYKLKLGICLIIPLVSSESSPAFQNIEAASEHGTMFREVFHKSSCSAKSNIALLHQRSIVGKRYIELHHRYFLKNLTTSSMLKNACRWLLMRTIIFENISKWLLLKGSCEEYTVIQQKVAFKIFIF